MHEEDPDFILLTPECKAWCNWSALLPKTLHDWKRSRVWPMVRFTSEVAQYQISRDKYFMIENPQGSAIWDTLIADKLFVQSGVCFDVLDQCQYGLRDRENGKLHLKPTALVHSMNQDIVKPLLKRCKPGSHEHQPLGKRNKYGLRTAQAQVYPEALCRKIAEVVKAQIA